jgi:hypothetical protein
MIRMFFTISPLLVYRSRKLAGAGTYCNKNKIPLNGAS